MTKLSPEGRPQPAFIHEYLAARKAVGLLEPQEMWDRRNGWVHYRDAHGAYLSLRKGQIEQMTKALANRVRT